MGLKMEFHDRESILDGAPDFMGRLSERWDKSCRDGFGKEARVVATDFANHPHMGRFAMAEIMSGPAVVGGKPALVLWVKNLESAPVDTFLLAREIATWIAVMDGFPGYENKRTLILGPLLSAILRNGRTLAVMDEERVDGCVTGFRSRCEAAIERVRDNPPLAVKSAGVGSGLLCLDAVNLFPDLEKSVLALPQKKCAKALKTFRKGKTVLDQAGPCNTPESALTVARRLLGILGISGWTRSDDRNRLQDAMDRA